MAVSPLLLGVATGAVCALIPGRLSASLVESARRGQRADVARPIVELLVWIAVGLGTSPLWRGAGASAGQRVLLALVYVALGLALALRALSPHGAASTGPLGALPCVLVTGFALWCGLVRAELGPSLAFAAGVWAGAVACLGAVLALRRLGERRAVAFLRTTAFLSAFALIALGAYALGHVMLAS